MNEHTITSMGYVKNDKGVFSYEVSPGYLVLLRYNDGHWTISNSGMNWVVSRIVEAPVEIVDYMIKHTLKLGHKFVVSDISRTIDKYK